MKRIRLEIYICIIIPIIIIATSLVTDGKYTKEKAYAREGVQKELIRDFVLASNFVISEAREDTTENIDLTSYAEKKLVPMIKASLYGSFEPEDSYIDIDNYRVATFELQELEREAGLLPADYKKLPLLQELISIKESRKVVQLSDLDFSNSYYLDYQYEGAVVRLYETELPITKSSFKNSTLFDFQVETAKFDLENKAILLEYRSGDILLYLKWHMKAKYVESHITVRESEYVEQS